MDTLNVDIQGPHLLCGDFNAHNPAWDTIAKPDNIGNYIAQWSYNNNYMITNDAYKPTFAYSR